MVFHLAFPSKSAEALDACRFLLNGWREESDIDPPTNFQKKKGQRYQASFTQHIQMRIENKIQFFTSFYDIS